MVSKQRGDKLQLHSSKSFCEIFRKNFMWKCHLSITTKKELFLKGVWIEDLNFKTCYFTFTQNVLLNILTWAKTF